MRFLICGRQTQGGREYQEDSWSVVTAEGHQHLNANEAEVISSEGETLVVLSDGIGSGGHGDVASRLIAGDFAGHLTKTGPVSPAGLQAAIVSLDAELCLLKQKEGYGPSMGGTVVAGHFRSNELVFLSVGDSHLLRFRDDEIHYMNEKHAVGHEQGELAGLGRISWREVLLQPGRSSITSAVIGSGIDTCQAAARQILPGDTYLLASDGVEAIDGELLRRLVSANRGASPQQILDAIIQAIDVHGRYLQNGLHDNATLVMVRCEAGDADGEKAELKGTDRESGRGTSQNASQRPVQAPSANRKLPGNRIGIASLILLLICKALGTYLWLDNRPNGITASHDPADAAKTRSETAVQSSGTPSPEAQ
jgi:serine/threonine protein phosphatase PrpC